MPRPPRDLQAYWDDLLTQEDPSLSPLGGEGWMPEWSSGHLGCQALVDRASEGITWASGDGGVAQERARRRLETLTYWLPVRDQETLCLHLEGLVQTEIAARLGITQTSVYMRLQRIRERLRLLASGPLPRDREHLRALVLAHEGWAYRADYFARWSKTWAGARAAEDLGQFQGTTWRWGEEASKLPEDDPLGHLVRVLRACYTQGGRTGRWKRG